MKIVVISGGFDPIHSGHISYIKSSSKIGDKLIVALNSDNWLIKKKGKFFLPFEERSAVLRELQDVDDVIGFKDDEQGSCRNALEHLKKEYPFDEIIFCNGGDRNEKNILEQDVKNIKFKFGLGGTKKKNSSSKILKKYSFSSEKRVWGEFYNFLCSKNYKLKELIITPKKGMSLQKHYYRNEIWFLSKGKCKVLYGKNDPNKLEEIFLEESQLLIIEKESWHQIINIYDEPCHIIEIQYGEHISEDDIDRHRFYEGN
ncbi:adenylyltransferase/cytidyltransferase family protein [Gammaproteobacteria bacterium]|nr:adenylyltransferase/cytidyltransferase family protein [Gammaproteobacteria bacterium]